MPTFWFALTLILWPASTAALPITGSASWQNFVMPAIALGYYVTPAVMRLTRAGAEVLRRTHPHGLRQGLRPATVVHTRRNAIIPVVCSRSAVRSCWAPDRHENLPDQRPGPPRLVDPATCQPWCDRAGAVGDLRR
jgi:hypothetical protein